MADNSKVVTLSAGGTDYKLRLNTNFICDAEDALDTGIDEIVKKIGRQSYCRELLFAALREHHPEVSRAQVGEVIDAAGMKPVGQALLKTLGHLYGK